MIKLRQFITDNYSTLETFMEIGIIDNLKVEQELPGHIQDGFERTFKKVIIIDSDWNKIDKMLQEYKWSSHIDFHHFWIKNRNKKPPGKVQNGLISVINIESCDVIFCNVTDLNFLKDLVARPKIISLRTENLDVSKWMQTNNYKLHSKDKNYLNWIKE